MSVYAGMAGAGRMELRGGAMLARPSDTLEMSLKSGTDIVMFAEVSNEAGETADQLRDL